MEVEKVFQDVPAGGNTKTPKKGDPPAVHWVFTYNNYSLEEIISIEKDLKQICEKYVFQEETGENENKHLQGYIMAKTKIRFSALKKINDKIHWEKCKSPIDAIKYCQKDETRTGNIFRFNIPAPPKPVKIITELREWQQQCVALLEEKNDRTIYWIWENEGNVGKTVFAKYLYLTKNIMYITGGKGSDILHVSTEALKNKPDCDIFLFDLPRSLEGCVSYNALEQIKNGFWTSTKYEGGTVCINNPTVMVFANWKPNEDMLSKDRWEIFEIKENKLEGFNWE
jgi:hypothetical protein